MYRDKTLIPTEAIRLCALGLLAEGERSYPALAGAVRHFTNRVAGPSLDLLGPPIELLRHEGLIEGEDAGHDSDAPLHLTDAGRAELTRLLTAPVRAPADETSKLVIALKFRFLDQLDPDARADQLAGLADYCAAERARLEDLRDDHAAGTPLAAWLDHEIAQLDDRIAWLEGYADEG